MAAQVYRAELFANHGFQIWDGQWYGGHHMPGYSMLMPPLGALLGAWWAGAAAAVVASLGFAVISADRCDADAKAAAAASLLFSSGVLASLSCGRTTYLLGLAFGSFAVALLLRDNWWWLPFALLTPLASPVAGLFLVLIGTAGAFGRNRIASVLFAVCSLAPIAVLAALFPEGGHQPFGAGDDLLRIAVACAALLWLIPEDQREVRSGIWLYILGAAFLFAVPTPVGSNFARLGQLVAASLVALALVPKRRPVLLAALLIPAIAWQWVGPISDINRTAGQRAGEAAFFTPLIDQLRARGGEPGRVEVVWTRSHWESAYVAPIFPLARGWERQLDERFNDSINHAPLDPSAYRRWIDSLAVHWVALPNALLDHSSQAEGDLIRAGVPWLKQVWKSPDWRLYEVTRPTAIATGAATATSLGRNSVALTATRAGVATVRVRWSPWWELKGLAGCVAASSDGFVTVRFDNPGKGSLAIEAEPSGFPGATARCGSPPA
jgi:hypothetical protein